MVRLTWSLLPLLSLVVVAGSAALADDQQPTPSILFDGDNLDAWTYPERAWYVDKKGALTCRMKEVKQKDGTTALRGMGYIWTKDPYDDFDLTLQYKLSKAANSGVFYRTDPRNPVHGGFEVQLMDNEGFQAAKGKRDARKLNGSFYDGKAPSSDPSRPVGQWNKLRLRCEGPRIQIWINDVQVIDVNVDDWDTPGKNPDGSSNKFKRALKDLPRTGHIGLQNHGQPVWFRDIIIRKL